MIDLLLMIGAVVAIGLVILPKFARAKVHGCRISCTNNLKQLNFAFRIWAGDQNNQMPMQVSITNGGAMELAEQGSAYEIFLVMSNELSTPKVLFCPDESNPKRSPANTFGTSAGAGATPLTPNNNLSYFVGLDAEDTKPTTILAGDDHISVAGIKPKPGLFLQATNAPVEWRNERHPKNGNVALADGSVQGFSIPAFRTALANTGIATNRLAMP